MNGHGPQGDRVGSSESVESSPPLRMLFWESTARCNLQCAHCRRMETEARDELSADEARAVFDSAAESGGPIVLFSGGEPLLRDDWAELAGYCRDRGLRTALASNGTLIDGATAERIAKAGFARVSVSLDGPDASTHDAFRGQPGAFESSLSGLGALRQQGVAFQINVTVARQNAGKLDAMLELARQQGAVAVHLFLLVPVGCGAELGQAEQLPPEDYRRLLEWFLARRVECDLELRATCAPQVTRVADEMGISLPGKGCLCGRSVVFVSHRGEVYPCGYLPVLCGSVRERSLAEVWRTSEVFADLRDPDRLTGACGRCGFRGLCGGCRARAYAATGDYLAAEPGCAWKDSTGCS